MPKANHAGNVPPLLYELEFNDGGLAGFRRCKESDWPELAPDLPALLFGILDGQELSIRAIAALAATPESTVSYHLRKDQRLESQRVGKEVIWRRKTARHNNVTTSEER